MKNDLAPILLITFNRPDYVKQLIDAIRTVKPPILYVFKDGPRPFNDSDQKASKEIEKIIATIDWPCRVLTNYLYNNLGCGYGPYSAISWVLGMEEEIIILEDDCIPEPSFFYFCTEMLRRYRENEKVRLISGRSQLSDHPIFNQYDYIFSQYALTLGWATWRRVWNNFDIQMRSVRLFFDKGGFNDEFATLAESKHFNNRYKRDYRDPNIIKHIWDHQFGYHARMNGSLGIVPAVNLIQYIGVEGTHPVSTDHALFQLRSNNNFRYKICPGTIVPIKEYDMEHFNKYVRCNIPLYRRVVNKLLKQYI